MLAKTAAICVAFAALVPAIAAMALNPAKTAAALERRVALEGPILSFSQTPGRIEVRLAAAAAPGKEPSRIVVRDAAGSTGEMAVSLKPGQTYVAARLDAALAGADALVISVE